MSAPQPYDTYLYDWLQLVAVLKEVHYMESRSYENVPAGALEPTHQAAAPVRGRSLISTGRPERWNRPTRRQHRSGGGV